MEQKKSAENLSQWFNLDEQKPWEPGVYEVSSSTAWNHLTYFSYWCGEKFHGGWGNPNEAYENKDHPGDGCGAEWRGLSSDPSAKPKARGNRRVTRYVVMDDIERKPVASFATKKAAENYEESMMVFSSIEKIRFRTPEAD